MIIAIDGPAASGKGTIAQRLAAHFQLGYLDTGLLYRAVGVAVHAAGVDPSDANQAGAIATTLNIETLNEQALRTAEAGRLASMIAAHPAVRSALLDRQRQFAARPEGAVLDGRDIGTVVCPNADAKLFVTAAVEERGRRRAAQLRERGEVISDDEMVADLRARDERDTQRAAAPMRPADDARHLDTTALTREDAYQAALNLVLTSLGDASLA